MSKHARSTSRRWTRVAALPVAALLIALPAAGLVEAEEASGGPVAVSVRKAVLTAMSATGAVTNSRVYTQVQASGNGTATVTDPVGPGKVRNLNGFADPTVTDGNVTLDLNVNGEQNLRFLQDYDAAALPVSISTTATLDGQPIDPAQIINVTGQLVVTYTLTNTTLVDQEVTWTGPTGQPMTKTAKVPVPLVGSASVTLPSSFSNVMTPTGVTAGNGRGETAIQYTVILFEPLGAPVTEVTYSAQVNGGTLPPAVFQLVPTAPKSNPTMASASDQYKGGSETGAKLTDGATQIDANILKIGDGAGLLNDGLKKLKAGSGKLTAALGDQAAPGAQQLATGLNGTAVPGAKKLAAGAKKLKKYMNGTAQPDGEKIVTKLVTASTDADELKTTVSEDAAYAALVNQVDSLATTVNDALNKMTSLSAGLGVAADGSSQIAAGNHKLANGLVTAGSGAQRLADGLNLAADGSGKITAGLGLAQPGSAKIANGAGRLSAEGTKLLIAAGEDTTNSFGEKYGVMMALNDRAEAGEGIPNGPATGTNVTTTAVYQFQVAGAPGEASKNALIAVLAVVALILAVGVAVVVGKRAG